MFFLFQNEEDEDLKIISIIGDVKQIENEDGIAVPDTHNYKVVPNTRVTFLAKTYRLVFILDISPSIASAVSIVQPRPYIYVFKQILNQIICH